MAGGQEWNAPVVALRSLGLIRQKSYTVGLMEHSTSQTKRDLTYLTQDETRRLFAVITDKRDRALFQLAYHHGLRASEVSLLHRGDLNTQQGRIYIPRVKGSIAKTYPLQPEDLRRLRAYLRTRRDAAPYLFISSRGIPLERRSYWDLMQKYGEQAGLPKATRRFHALRHAIAVHLLDAGADVAFVQDRLGHANIQNTIRYMRYTTATRDMQTRSLFASPQVV
jgi:type 1 fimbriae regulatory protein FimB